MTAAQDALAVLSGWRAPDGAQEALRREYVDLLRGRPDATDRCCLPGHLTASTLLLSADLASCLLTLHAKAGRWFQLGGHCEPTDQTLAGAARREAEEESGLAGLALDPVPVQLDAHTVAFCGGPGTRHLDVRFVAVAPAAGRAVASGSAATRADSALTGRAQGPTRRSLAAHKGRLGPGSTSSTSSTSSTASTASLAGGDLARESADLRWWPLDRLPTDERSVVHLVRLALERVAAR